MDKKEMMEKVVEKITTSENDRVNGMMKPEVVYVDEEKGMTCVSFKAQEWEKNHRGQLHGGIVVAMFDLLMGSAAHTYTGTDVTTTEIQTSFIRPFGAEEYLFECEMVNPGKTLVRVCAKAREKDTGKVAAMASGSYMVLRQKG